MQDSRGRYAGGNRGASWLIASEEASDGSRQGTLVRATCKAGGEGKVRDQVRVANLTTYLPA